MSQQEKRMNILHQQKNIYLQQSNKLSEEKEKIENEIKEGSEIINELTNKHSDVEKTLKDLEVKEAADPE